MCRKILCRFIGIFHNHKPVFQFPPCIPELWFRNPPLAVNHTKDCHTLCILHFSCHLAPPHSKIFTVSFFIDKLAFIKWASPAKALNRLASIRIPCCHHWPLATISISKSAYGLPLLGIFPSFRKCLPAPHFCKSIFAVCWHEIQLMNPFWRIVFQCSFTAFQIFFQFFKNSTQYLSTAWYNSYVASFSAW